MHKRHPLPKSISKIKVVPDEWSLLMHRVLKEPESSLFKISIFPPGILWNDSARRELALRMMNWHAPLATTFYTHSFSWELNICFTIITCSLILSFHKACACIFGFLLWKTVMLMFIMLHLLHSNRRYFPKTWLLQTGDLMAQTSRNLKLKSWSEAQNLK